MGSTSINVLVVHACHSAVCRVWALGDIQSLLLLPARCGAYEQIASHDVARWSLVDWLRGCIIAKRP